MRMEKNLFTKLTVAVAMLLLAGSLPVHATLGLRLSGDNGATWTTVLDGGPGDASPVTGVVLYLGSIGNWNLIVTAGISKPQTGSPAIPYLDISSRQSSLTGPTTLSIQISDTDFTPLLPFGQNYLAGVGGTTDGTVTFGTWADAGNALFAKTTALTSLGPLGPGAFDSQVSASTGPAAAPYSLTLEVVVSHPAGGNTGF